MKSPPETNRCTCGTAHRYGARFCHRCGGRHDDLPELAVVAVVLGLAALLVLAVLVGGR